VGVLAGIGDLDGVLLGDCVGLFVCGASVGNSVGNPVGFRVGFRVGALLGALVGLSDVGL
jgi:hypothetical protein